MPKHPAVLAATLGAVVALGATIALSGAFPTASGSAMMGRSYSGSLPGPDELDRLDGTPPAMRSILTAALHRWPEHYNGGLVGVEGLLDPTGVTADVSPSTAQTWVTYLTSEAQAAQWDPSYSEDERGQILAFSHGLTRAVRDGKPPAPTDPVEGAPAMPIAAPTAFLHSVFYDPYRALPVNTCGDGSNGESEASGPAYDTVADDGCPGGVGAMGRAEPRRGYLVDYFLDLRADLEVVRERIRLDRDYVDAANGVTERRSKPIDTVRGLRVAAVDVEVCPGARDLCQRDMSGDFASDERLWVAERYATAWIAAIDEGLLQFGELGAAVTRGLYDSQVVRHARIAECGTSPSGIIVNPHNGCETTIGPREAVLWAAQPYISQHMLAMLGAPSALPELDAPDVSLEALDEFANQFEGLVDPFVSPVRDSRHILTTLAHAKIERAYRPAVMPDAVD